MDDYNFWQDFFDTYQSLSDWMKFAWLIVPPLFVLGIFALIMRFRLSTKNAAKLTGGELIYSVHRDEFDQLHVYQHGEHINHEPSLLLLNQPKGDAT